jgi:hypothetical protein
MPSDGVLAFVHLRQLLKPSMLIAKCASQQAKNKEEATEERVERCAEKHQQSVRHDP